MSRLRNRFLTMPTAKGSMAIALVSLTVSACGGTGDRHPPENLSTSDAGLNVDPCNPSATLDLETVGCAPELRAANPYLYCPDFERGDVTNSHAEHDPLALSPAPSGTTGWSFDSCRDAPAGTVCLAPSSGHMTPSTMDTSAENILHCGSGKRAFHMVTRGQLRWGPQAYIQYDDGTNYPSGPATPVTDMTKWPTTAWGLDVSDWDGIAFWIRAGDQPLVSTTPTNATLVTGNSTFVSLISPWTNAQADDPNGVRCSTAADAPDPEKCDDFGFPVAYSDQWEYKVLPFSELRQRGFGVHEDKPDLNHLIQLKFGFEVGDYWNVWIDDISLWRKK